VDEIERNIVNRNQNFNLIEMSFENHFENAALGINWLIN
jgi:hypothetical protein